MSEIMEGVKILMEQEDIVEIDDQMILIDKVVKNRIHKGLEGSWSVTEAEGHDQGFEEAKFAFKGGFPFIAFSDTDVVVTPADVELGKVAGTLEFVDEFGNQG